MPGVIEQCGLSTAFSGGWLALAGAANMAGSIGIGVLMRRCASAPLLMAIYAMRAVSVALFLVAPPSPCGRCCCSRSRWAPPTWRRCPRPPSC